MSRSALATGASNVAIAAGTLLLTCAALEALLPDPELEQITPKLRFLAEHGRDYDTIIVGSSRVYRGVSPAVFDAELAKAGRHSRSFNFGIEGMHPPERFLILDKILALPSVKPRWMLLEFDELQANIADEKETERAVYWHDRASTALILRKLLELDRRERWKRKLFRARFYEREIRWHLQGYVRHELNIGRASDVFSGWCRRAHLEPPLIESSLAEAGFRPLDGKLTESQAAKYNDAVALMKRQPPDRVDTYTEQSYKKSLARMRAAGTTPVLFVTPVAGPFPPTRFDGAPPAPLLLFNNPNAFPDLYKPEVRIDLAHLNRAGANEFTRLLAQDFVKTTSPR